MEKIKKNFKVAFLTNANYPINEASKNWGWDLYPANSTKTIEFKKYNVLSFFPLFFFSKNNQNSLIKN
jgi:hypothetical protein